MDKKRSVYVGQCIDLVGGDASNNYVTNMWHAKALLLFVGMCSRQFFHSQR